MRRNQLVTAVGVQRFENAPDVAARLALLKPRGQAMALLDIDVVNGQDAEKRRAQGAVGDAGKQEMQAMRRQALPAPKEPDALPVAIAGQGSAIEVALVR